jgi:hypothetical protein
VLTETNWLSVERPTSRPLASAMGEGHSVLWRATPSPPCRTNCR